jgi:multicomponent Na+:H+ antiporter subunit F
MSGVSAYLLLLLLALLATMLLGLVRVMRGPSMGDRLTSIQLLGTGGVGVLFLLSQVLQLPALIDVALVLALLAAVLAAALTRREVDDA